MHASVVRKCTAALAAKELPICPGDMLVFQASGHRMLVVACSDQLRASGSTGQQVAGVVSATQAWWWSDFWIDWTGFREAWSIHRGT